MAKIKLEIDLDWLGEDGSVDETIKEEIINNITSKVNKDILKTAENTAKERIEEVISLRIDEHVNKILEEMMLKEFQPVDRYGDAVGKKKTVKGMIKDRLDNYMTESVDSNGNKTEDRYNSKSTRMEWILSKIATTDMKRQIDKVTEEANKKIKQYIESELKAKLGENMSKLIGIDDTLKNLR